MKKPYPRKLVLAVKEWQAAVRAIEADKEEHYGSTSQSFINRLNQAKQNLLSFKL